MYRLLRASVLRLYAGTFVKHLSGTRTESLRRWKRAGGPALKALQEPHTLLEPHTQEHFLFPDWGTEHEDDGEVLEKGPQLRGPQRNNDDDGEMLERGPQLGALQRKHRDDDGEVRTQSKQLRGLERQLELMKGPVEEHSLIDFHDEGFPLHKPKKKRPQKVFGSPDAQAALSETSCSGCGALLHCTDPQEPGYLPSEKYKPLLEGGGLERAVCQRCFLIQHQQRALSVRMSPDQYRAVVGSIRPLSALVLLILDLLDLPHSIIPDLPQLLGRNKRVVVLGNKVDLLPGDAQNYLQRVRRQLMADCARAGISADPRDVHLISAKTGYGIETLISSLQTRGRHRGDVYLIGMANAGKSTLFNTLLESDYCKSTAADAIHRATISPWPGQTLTHTDRQTDR
nr:nitric oxide-associated protein 1-like [Danio rerio]|eukprot:XP_005174712.1 nitric oxide-associated protein 1-like [Danio rerio]